MRKIEAVLFDLDGTLVDSNNIIIDSFRHVMTAFFPERLWSRKNIMEMIGPPLYDTFKKYASSEEMISDMIFAYRKYYVENEFDSISLYPGVKETLTELKNKNCRLGVVTTKFRVSALPSLEHFGLDKLFEEIVSLDEITHAKPHPEPVLYALKQLKCHFGIMVGDHPSDIVSGKAAGIATCAVDWSLKRKELELSSPDYWIKDFRQLIKIVDDINKEE